ncbi:methyl-accepting chemotaxis protein [Acetonema longum]|uniref:Methyl-accepting chemotaxis sensory transducer n=1 Tax=Acetonema longum DSM 6540 TaxID=1009370 RepID=F7NE64_9FIRM|nr:methyl-accepting chemotaxis protein [Acetonema longum]EGO65719.1 methyl-accepting chemotaxis sensory transducer [Acetonema longum DSM 6540]
MHINIRKQILLALSLIVLLFTGLLAYGYYQLEVIKAGYMGVILRSAPLVVEVKDVNGELRNQSSLVRAYLLTGEENYIVQYDQSRSRMDKTLDSLQTKLITPEGKQKTSDLKQVLAEYHSAADKAIHIGRTQGRDAAVKVIAEGASTAKAAETQMNDLVTFLSERMILRTDENDAMVGRVELTLLVWSLIVIILSIATGIRFSGRISRPLQALAAVAGEIAAGNLVPVNIKYKGQDEITVLILAFTKMSLNLRNILKGVTKAAEQLAASSEQLTASADQTAKASTQVAQTIESVASGATGQTRVVNQTETIVNDMTQAISHIARNSEQVLTKSHEASAAARVGNEAVNEATNQMSQIQNSVSHAAVVVEQLGANSNRIGTIVSAIQQIAGQTNLLALNAAIEAARAGEHGRGFAVVAEEVRKLAGQSQLAAKEISEIIQLIQTDTQTAVQAMQSGTDEVNRGITVITDTGERFRSIVTVIDALNGEIQEISTVAEELSASSGEVGHSVGNVKQIAVETAASTQTISAAAEEQTATMQEIASACTALARMAENMQNMVATFRF